MKVAVVGAGVAGSVVAIEAIRRGWDVTVFDASDAAAPSCSTTAAGMLSPYAELETADSTMFALGMRSLDHWPALLEVLPETVFFRRDGSLLTAHGSDVSLLHHLLRLIERKAGERLVALTPGELAMLEPALPLSGELVHLPHEGQIDSQGFINAARAFLAGSGILRTMRVASADAGAVTLDSGAIDHFDWVFDCRGFAAKTDLPQLRGVRGEIIWVHAPGVSISRPVRLMHPRYRVYLVPRPGDVYLVGATEIESEDRSPLTVRSALELLSALFSIHPEFAEARIIRTDVNLRPAFPDNTPRVDHGDGVTRINGLFRHGFLLAPALAEDAIAFVDTSASTSRQEVSHVAD